MKRAPRKIAYALAVLMLSGCALPRGTAPPEKVAQIKTLIVMPAIEDYVTLSHIGVTVFDNRFDAVAVEWDFTGVMRNELENALGEQYQIVPFDYDAKALRNKVGTVPNRVEMDQRVKEIVPADVADALLLVVADRSAHIAGRSLYGTTITVFYRLGLYDGHTLRPLAHTVSGIACDNPICVQSHKTAAAAAPFRWEGGDPEASFSPLQEQAKETALSLLKESAPNGLGRLGLIPVQPPGP